MNNIDFFSVSVIETKMSSDEKVISILTEIAYYYKLLGDKWRAKSFSNAAQLIKSGGGICGKNGERHFDGKHNLSDTTSGPRQCIDIYKQYGIGEKIRAVILEVLRGKVPQRLLKLRGSIDAVAELEKVMGIGPVRAKEFVKRGIKSVRDLKKVANELTHMQRLGLTYLDDLSVPIPRNTVRKMAKKIMARSGIGDWNLVGSWRRGHQTSGDVDILICGAIFPSVEKKAGFISYIVHGNTRRSFLMRDENGVVRQVDLRTVEKKSYPTALLYFTGSRSFNIAIRALAKKNGFKLSEYGLFRGKKEVSVNNEKDIFKKLGIAYIAPEKRDNSVLLA